MPWWSWIVIWVALLALSLLYVVLLGIKLWRHVVRLGKEFSEASARMGNRPGGPDGELPGRTAETPLPEREPGWAVSSDPALLAEEYRAGKRRRRIDRVRRRVARRRLRGQAQSLRDLELAKANK